MDERPPEAPQVPIQAVQVLLAWLEATAEWLEHDHATARRHGHLIPPEATSNQALFEDAALLLREAYGVGHG